MANETGMTKEAFEAIKSEYGEKICAILIDNAVRIMVNMTGDANSPGSGYLGISDLTVVTFGGTDFLKVPRVVKTQGSTPLHQVSLFPLCVVQGIVICDEEPITRKVKDPATGEMVEKTLYYRVDPKLI